MDILLSNGDVQRDALGFPATASGPRALIQRALIRLSVPRGSFLLDPSLGSDLSALRGLPRSQLDPAALEAVRQALLPLTGVEVSDVHCLPTPDGLHIQLTLSVLGQSHSLEVTTNL